jgi:hypothetical protein
MRITQDCELNCAQYIRFIGRHAGAFSSPQNPSRDDLNGLPFPGLDETAAHNLRPASINFSNFFLKNHT